MQGVPDGCFNRGLPEAMWGGLVCLQVTWRTGAESRTPGAELPVDSADFVESAKENE